MTVTNNRHRFLRQLAGTGAAAAAATIDNAG
jgi:hypothetical protein